MIPLLANAYTDNSWMRNSNNVNGLTTNLMLVLMMVFSTDTSGSSHRRKMVSFANQSFLSVSWLYRNGFESGIKARIGGTVTVPQDASNPYFWIVW